MTSTQRYLFQHDALTAAATALGVYETPLDVSIQVVYTRQQHAPWTYCIGQCLPGQRNHRLEVYRSFAFISRSFRGVTLRSLVESLTTEIGIEIAPDFPSLRLTAPHPNWREDIVPAHATATRTAAR